jgi:UDP-glucuronate 4-epimerase
MKILVTGGAGFIGSHACEKLLTDGHTVVALDNFDSYYSPKQKRRNVLTAQQHPRYTLVEGDFGDRHTVGELLQAEKFDAVLHLAAQAGVRPSIENPLKYERANVGNVISFLEALREHGPKKIVAASSSSVYGNSTPVPFREDAPCMQPISPYGATKRAGEIFMGTYSALYGFKAIVVRPFTVYGPRQRPDMAIAAFAKKILTGETITLFGDGSTARDYTFVSDLVAGLVGALNTFPVDFGIYNLGGESPISLNDLVVKLEQATGKKAVIERLPMQPGDVTRTYADVSKARRDFGYSPCVSLDEGLARTVAWVKSEMQSNGGPA